MKKRNFWLMILILISFASFACGPELHATQVWVWTEESAQGTSQAYDSTQEAKPTPTMLATLSQESYSSQSGSAGFENVVAGSHEYAVEGTNFDCVCSGIANLTIELNFTGNQLEFNQDGMETKIYDKTGYNTYGRTFLVTYASITIENGKEVKTEVEGESREAIILNQNGFIREQYGIAGLSDSGSACCYHSFIIKK